MFELFQTKMINNFKQHNSLKKMKFFVVVEANLECQFRALKPIRLLPPDDLDLDLKRWLMYLDEILEEAHDKADKRIKTLHFQKKEKVF